MKKAIFLMIFVVLSILLVGNVKGVIISVDDSNIVNNLEAKHIVDANIDGPAGVFSTDLDGDGDNDIIISGYHSDILNWYENNGNFNFTKHTLDTNLDFYNAISTDLDGDGDNDIMATTSSSLFIMIYSNNGNGTFTRTNEIQTDYSSYAINSTDLDGDGDDDIISTSGPTLNWYENNGNFNFTKHIIDDIGTNLASVFSTDLDGDGDNDIVTSANGLILAYKNDGSGTFTRTTIINEADYGNIWLSNPIDFNNDGLIDIFSSATTSDFTIIFENLGNTYSYTQHIIDQTSLEQRNGFFSTDLDGDGDNDVITTDFSVDELNWYENNGNFNFTKHTLDTNLDGAIFSYVSNIGGTNDGDIIASALYGNVVYVYEMNFNSPPTFNSVSIHLTSQNINSKSIIETNVTDADNDNVDYCNFTITSPNGTTLINNINGTKAPTTNKLFISGVSDIYQYDLMQDYNISKKYYNQSYDSTNSYGIFLTQNNLFITNKDDKRVYKYTITDWDISTAELNQLLDLSTEDNTPISTKFNNNGTIMYMLGNENSRIFQYSLSTPYDLTTATLSSSYTITEDTNVRNFFINNTKLFIVGNANNKIYQYSITDWDISTATYITSISTPDTSTTGIFFKPNGNSMYITGSNLYEYTLSTAYNITTAILSKNISVSETATLNDLFFQPTQTKSSDIWYSQQYDISLGGSYEYSITCKDNQSNSATTSSNFFIINNSLTIDINTTDSDLILGATIKPLMNFTTDYEEYDKAQITIYKDGSILVSTYNMTCDTNEYNSFNCTGNEWVVKSGEIAIKYYVETNGINQTAWYNKTIPSTIYTNPETYTKSVFSSSELNDSFTLKVWQDTITEFSYNLTCDFSEPLITISTNISDFNVTGTTSDTATKINISITADNSLADGEYTGNCTIERAFDNQTKTINLTYAKNPPMARVWLYDNSDNLCQDTFDGYCEGVTAETDSATFYEFVKAKNDGGYNASNCNLYLDNDFTGKSWYSFNETNFDLNINETKSLKITFSSVTAGEYMGNLYIKCDNASAYGYSVENNVDNRPFYYLVISETTTSSGGESGGGGGGGTGEIIVISENQTIFSVKTKTLSKEYLFYMMPDTSKTKQMEITNLIDKPLTFKIYATAGNVITSKGSRQIDLTNIFSIDESTITIPANSFKTIDFTTTIPKTAKFGERYTYKIVVEADGYDDKGSISVQAIISPFGKFTSWFSKFTEFYKVKINNKIIQLLKPLVWFILTLLFWLLLINIRKDNVWKTFIWLFSLFLFFILSFIDNYLITLLKIPIL